MLSLVLSGVIMGKPCSKKKRFLTEVTAQTVLDELVEFNKKMHRKPREKNIYKCPICGFWHLTSQKLHSKQGGSRER